MIRFRVDAEDGRVILEAESIAGFYVHEGVPEQPVTFCGVSYLAGDAGECSVGAGLEFLSGSGVVVGVFEAPWFRVVSASTWSNSSPSGAQVVVSNLYNLPYPYALDIWRRFEQDVPLRPNEWADYPVEWRKSWLHVVQRWSGFESRYSFENRATRVLEGSLGTTPDGLFLALGEAVNGVGGYLGMNLDGMQDLLRDWREPIAIEWRDFDVTQAHLGAEVTQEFVDCLTDNRVRLIGVS